MLAASTYGSLVCRKQRVCSFGSGGQNAAGIGGSQSTDGSRGQGLYGTAAGEFVKKDAESDEIWKKSIKISKGKAKSIAEFTNVDEREYEVREVCENSTENPEGKKFGKYTLKTIETEGSGNDLVKVTDNFKLKKDPKKPDKDKDKSKDGDKSRKKVNTGDSAMLDLYIALFTASSAMMAVMACIFARRRQRGR